MAARPWAPMCLSLAAETLVSVTSDPDAVLRDHGNNSDVRIGVYRAVSSGAVDLGSGTLPATLREQFARECDPNCLMSLLDAARAIPGEKFEDDVVKRAWFEASVGLLERLGCSLGEEERSAGFELCGRFYGPSTTTEDANVRCDHLVYFEIYRNRRLKMDS